MSEKQGKSEREVPVIQSPSPSPPPTKCHTCACHIISGHPSNIIPGRVISHQAALCGHKGEGATSLSHRSPGHFGQPVVLRILFATSCMSS